METASGKVLRPIPQVRHPLLDFVPRWYDVRGYDGRLLFRFCPSALVIEIESHGQRYPLVDLLDYLKRDNQDGEDWRDVSATDGRLLFRLCARSMLVRISVRGIPYPPINLMDYIKRDAEIETRFYPKPEFPRM